MSQTKTKGRIAFLRQWRMGRELSRDVRESLMADEADWVVRNSQGSGNTTIEFVEGGDKDRIRWTVKLLPCCLCRGCQTVQLCVDGAPVWLPPLARLLLRNVARYCVLRYALGVADKTLLLEPTELED
ncbi:MAG TPA: hypothetical protein VL175_07365 [Pirellulales bacterium]|jgi:hypothetical protein|nr:hypothetical protein [Pirellulales bacterium]